jgi:hypothetical protein
LPFVEALTDHSTLTDVRVIPSSSIHGGNITWTIVCGTAALSPQQLTDTPSTSQPVCAAAVQSAAAK